MATVYIDDARRDEPGGPIAQIHVRGGSWHRASKALGAIVRPGTRYVAVATGRSPEATIVAVDRQLHTFAADGTTTSNLADMADKYDTTENH